METIISFIAVRKLRKKWANRDSVSLGNCTYNIWLSKRKSTHVYGQALEGNEKVERLHIYGSDRLVNLNGANLLLRFIATCPSLKTFCITDVRDEDMALTYLKAAAANSSIERVSIDYVPSLDKIAILMLETSTSMKYLCLMATDPNHDAITMPFCNTTLTDAIANNETLEILDLRNWNFDGHPNTSTLEKNWNLFTLFSAGIERSQSIRQLAFGSCTFDSYATTALMNLLCGPKSHIDTLSFAGMHLYFHDEKGHKMNIETFLKELIQANSLTNKLKQIDLESLRIDAERLLLLFQNDGLDLEDLRVTITMDTLNVYNILGHLHGLKRLYLYNHPFFVDTVNLDRDLIVKELRKNFCLQTFSSIYGNESIFSLEQQHIIDLLCKRNETLQNWMDNPNLIPKESFHHALASCVNYENQTDIIVALMKTHWGRHKEKPQG